MWVCAGLGVGWHREFTLQWLRGLSLLNPEELSEDYGVEVVVGG